MGGFCKLIEKIQFFTDLKQGFQVHAAFHSRNSSSISRIRNFGEKVARALYGSLEKFLSKPVLLHGFVSCRGIN